MKRKFSSQFTIPDDPKAAIAVLYKQLKDVTDDLRIALDGNIGISDNMQAVYATFVVNSGVEVLLPKTKLARVMGALIVNTDSATVDSFKTRFSSDGSIYATCTFTNTDSATLTFLILGA